MNPDANSTPHPSQPPPQRRTRIPTLDRLSTAAASTAAIAILGGWLFLTRTPDVDGVPVQVVWSSVVVGCAIGVVVGARQPRLAATAVLGILVLVAVTATGLVLLVLPHLHLRLAAPVAGGLVGVAIASLAGAAVGNVRRVGLRPGELLVVASVAAFLIGDWIVLRSPGIRDLRLYLVAGHHLLDGGQIYITAHLTALPSDPAALPFLYPPMTLPFFALLAALPEGLVVVAWLVASIGAAVLSLRAFGVRWWCVPLLLLWPPLFEGVWVGNVAVPALLLFAIGPRLPGALPLSATFKLQAVVPSLWLVRERRWSSLAIGLGLLAALAVGTLPFVGLRAWGAWLDALQLFQASEASLPALYGAALPRHLPYAAFLAVALVAVGAAMVVGRGRRGLAGFGIASVVASPSLYRHGFLVVMPGLLGNGETVFWLALGIGFTPTAVGWWLSTSIGWWLIVAIAVLGTLRWTSVGTRPRGSLHPLGQQREPWA